MPKYLITEEVAEELRTKVGRRVLYAFEDVEAFIREARKDGAAAELAALLLRGGDAEPPGGVVAPSIRRNTSAEAVAQPRRKSRELTSVAEQAEAEFSALGGATA